MYAGAASTSASRGMRRVTAISSRAIAMGATWPAMDMTVPGTQ
jgi:hypothetical protein